MPSLDGYSLNEKMDKKIEIDLDDWDTEFEEIEEAMEVLKFRITTELDEVRELIRSVTVKPKKKSSKKKEEVDGQI